MLLSNTKKRLGETFDGLSLGDQDKLQMATNTAAEIAHLKLTGADTEYEEAALIAIVSNWASHDASSINNAFWESVDEGFSLAGKFLGGFATGALAKIAGMG